MKLIFIRHGDPNYVTDRLNETGLKEASSLKEYLAGKELGNIFVSPLGRARQTAEIALGSLENVTTFDWLREFNTQLDLNNHPDIQIAYNVKPILNGEYKLRETWDMLPRFYYGNPELHDPKLWKETILSKYSQHVEQYDYVTKEFDKLLSKYGYVRSGSHYQTEQGNHETLTFFCHFGIICVMLSHLMNISPYVLLQNICIPPTGITTVYTEEREKGIINFRTTQIGSTPHLEQPSFNGRFVEVFEDEGRH